jgi:hypothetical protein
MSSPTSEIDALLAELSEDDGERDVMRRVIDLLPFAAEEVEPPAALRQRVLQAISEDARPATFTEQGFYFARSDAIEPMTVPGNNRIKWLWTDPDTGARVGIVYMPPNAQFPAHPHDHIEDLYLVEGEAWVAGVHMRPGDYCRSPIGTAHVDLRSGEHGAVSFVVQR